MSGRPSFVLGRENLLLPGLLFMYSRLQNGCTRALRESWLKYGIAVIRQLTAPSEVAVPHCSENIRAAARRSNVSQRPGQWSLLAALRSWETVVQTVG